MKTESIAVNPYNGLFEQRGWACPKCGRVYSPFTPMCSYCKKSSRTMTKTIEEAAREYVNDVYSGDTDFIDEAENVLTWLFERPLADRLTDAEKEMVRKAYESMSNYGKNKGAMCVSCANYAARLLMQHIFGADFFKEMSK